MLENFKFWKNIFKFWKKILKSFPDSGKIITECFLGTVILEKYQRLLNITPVKMMWWIWLRIYIFNMKLPRSDLFVKPIQLKVYFLW